ncbi:MULTISPECIES: GAF domain-containing protein [Novosphingobium]|uniref:GAF domain-containing protein n=1 Tax=unclassified Novosphingobium TaxID=2644732 RepID=UPI0006C83B19|nr:MULTISPECIES: GAF domain-containing protein [unclassified Novosphingobium]KPH66306.1 Fis family transcriptional regulator [Novosphingobium sp. ST904]MPS70786.1 sigma-54-dependent Fis family transcriptional regulator [Novosphingobium sp.]TCM33706.1 regulatory Fis family protein [Novosphingobium sp. ST904]
MSRNGPRHIDVVLDAVRSPSSAGTSAVTASWCRSLLHHGLDPGTGAKRSRVEAALLAHRRSEHAALLTVAQPVLDQMFRSVGRSGCGVILSDPTGIVLDRRVCDGDADEFNAVGLVEGGRWGEAEEGTNGIGTCLFEDQPVVIHRDQHFASRNVGISCMDAPLHDHSGRLIGALDVSSYRQDHGPAMAELVSALVRDAARRIERDYFCQHFAGARIVFLAEDPTHGSALLATDRDDLVIGASRGARMKLRLTDAMLAQPRPLDQLLGTDTRGPSFEDGDRTILRRALAQAGGNASAAARILGVGRATLYRRMAKAGLSR